MAITTATGTKIYIGAGSVRGASRYTGGIHRNDRLGRSQASRVNRRVRRSGDRRYVRRPRRSPASGTRKALAMLARWQSWSATIPSTPGNSRSRRRKRQTTSMPFASCCPMVRLACPTANATARPRGLGPAQRRRQRQRYSHDVQRADFVGNLPARNLHNLTGEHFHNLTGEHMKLNDVKVDSNRIEAGAWIDELSECPGLRLRVRGQGNKEWRKLQTKLLDAVPRKKRVNRLDYDEGERITNLLLLNTAFARLGRTAGQRRKRYSV